MAYAPINLGTAPSGSDGDPVRAAFVKVNYLLSDMASGAAATPNFALSDVAANWRGVKWTTSGSTRFDMALSGGAESGSNAGSNLYLRRFDDKGVWAGDVLNINRASGLVTITPSVTMLGTLTAGALNVGGWGQFTAAAGANMGLLLSAASGQARFLQFLTGASRRWEFGANGTAEGGSNAGSNLYLNAFDDSNNLLSTPFSIARATGVTAFSARPTFAGKTPWDSGNLTPSNYAALSGAAYSGPVSVSTTANATKLGINGWGDNHGFGIAMQAASGVYTGSAILFSNPDGYTSGSISLVTDHVVYNTTSDYRLKTVVGDAKGALDVVRDTPVHRYTRKSGDGTVYVGFLAHELQERVPYAVHGEKDARREMEVRGDLGEVVGTRVVDDYQMVDYPSLTGMLWAALQEAIARIEALEARE